jgi:hypothetical protein
VMATSKWKEHGKEAKQENPIPFCCVTSRNLCIGLLHFDKQLYVLRMFNFKWN